MINAGNNIRQLAQKRKKKATKHFIKTLIWAIALITLYLIIDTVWKYIPIIICGVCAYLSFSKGRELLSAARRATQGLLAEALTARILSELLLEGWNAKYNIPLKYWGDVDAFLCSPRGNYYVVDTKSDGGTVFFDGTRLMKRYGKKVYSFSNNKDILKAVKGQAKTLKKMKGVSVVIPLLCFTKATLDIRKKNNRVENVYVITLDKLVSTLRELEK